MVCCTYMQKFIRSLLRWLNTYRVFIVSLCSSLLVSIWTVLRHITNGINFDVVGQVGVAGQWASGIFGGVQLGSTHYLIKIPFYMLVNTFGFIEPKTRLLLLALLFNITAILVIYWLGRKILGLYNIKSSLLLEIGILWLSLISGRVLWTDYANSRNLEIAGGIAVLYLVLKLWREWRPKTALWLLGLATIVFFSDPLQLFVIGVGAGAYGLVTAYFPGNKAEKLKTSATLLAAGAMSKILLIFTTTLLPVRFLEAPKIDFTYKLDTFTTLFQNVVSSTLRVFDINILGKGFGVNSIRQLGGVVLLGFILFVIIRYRQKVKNEAVMLLWMLIGWNYLVYAASGNALKPLTERYIALVPVLLLLIFALHGGIVRKREQKASLASYLIISVSGLLLVGAVVVNWPNRFTLDKPMFAIADFARNSTYDFIITTRGLAIPGNYYAGYSKTIIPTICADNTRIVTSNLFYDESAYRSRLGRTPGKTALVIPAEGVVSDPFSCSREAVLAQLGQPDKQFELDNVGTIYEYSSNTETLRQL